MIEEEKKKAAMEFLIKYHDSDYCYEEDGTFYSVITKKKITVSELYDELMNK